MLWISIFFGTIGGGAIGVILRGSLASLLMLNFDKSGTFMFDEALLTSILIFNVGFGDFFKTDFKGLDY